MAWLLLILCVCASAQEYEPWPPEWWPGSRGPTWADCNNETVVCDSSPRYIVATQAEGAWEPAERCSSMGFNDFTVPSFMAWSDYLFETADYMGAMSSYPVTGQPWRIYPIACIHPGTRTWVRLVYDTTESTTRVVPLGWPGANIEWWSWSHSERAGLDGTEGKEYVNGDGTTSGAAGGGLDVGGIGALFIPTSNVSAAYNASLARWHDVGPWAWWQSVSEGYATGVAAHDGYNAESQWTAPEHRAIWFEQVEGPPNCTGGMFSVVHNWQLASIVPNDWRLMIREASGWVACFGTLWFILRRFAGDFLSI